MNDLLDLDDWGYWTSTKAAPHPPSSPKIKIELDSKDDLFSPKTMTAEDIPRAALGDITNATEPTNKAIKFEHENLNHASLNELKTTLEQNVNYRASFPIPVEIAAAKAREFTRTYFPGWAVKNLEETTPPHIRQILAARETNDWSPSKRSVNKFVGDLTKDTSDNNLFVSSLTNEITEDNINHYFSKYGYIDKIQQQVTQEGQGNDFFVRFHNAKDAQSAMSGLEGIRIRWNDNWYPMDIQKATTVSSSVSNGWSRSPSSEINLKNSAPVENGNVESQERNSSDCSILFFRNLDPQVTIETLREGLHIYGHINSIEIEDQFPGHAKVKMSSDDAGLAALKGLQCRTLYGQELEISTTPFDQAFAEVCADLPPVTDYLNDTTKPPKTPISDQQGAPSEQIYPRSDVENFSVVQLRKKVESKHATLSFGAEDPFVEFEKSLETKFQDFQSSTVQFVQQALNALRQSVEDKFQDAEKVQQRMLNHHAATSNSVLALLKSSVIDGTRLQVIEDTCQNSKELEEMRKLLTSVVGQGLENIKLKGSFLHDNNQLTSQIDTQTKEINTLIADNNALKTRSYDFTEALSKQKCIQEIEVGRLIKQNKNASIEIGALRIENQGLKAAQKTIADVNKSIVKELNDLRNENDRLKTRLVDGSATDEDDPEVAMLRESLNSESAICEVLRQQIAELSAKLPL